MFNIKQEKNLTLVYNSSQNVVGEIINTGRFKPATNIDFSQQDLEQLSEAVQRHLSVRRLKR